MLLTLRGHILVGCTRMAERACHVVRGGAGYGSELALSAGGTGHAIVVNHEVVAHAGCAGAGLRGTVCGTVGLLQVTQIV